jgi:single-strand DNA-binding protein
MNKVILMGRLTRDPEVRYSSGEKSIAIARFRIAVDRRFKRAGDTVEADFFDCTSLGKQGEFVERYLRKGTKVLVSGRIENDNYTNREGQKVYSVRVITEEIEFAESKAASSRNDGYQRGDDYQRSGDFQSMPDQASNQPMGGDFMNIPVGVEDEGLPFN